MQHTQNASARERATEQFARQHAIEVLTLRAQIAQARLKLDELTGNLTPDARDALRHDLVTFTEAAEQFRAVQ